MKEKTLSDQEIEDFLSGAEILGTDGGGGRAWADIMLYFLREKGFVAGALAALAIKGRPREERHWRYY